MVLRAHGYDPASDTCFAQADRFDRSDPRWPYLQGTSLLLRNPEAALPFLRRAVELCDAYEEENTAPRLRLAETLLELGRTEEAEAQFRVVLAQEPDNPRVHYNLGLLASTRNDLKGSIDHLQHSASSPSGRQKSYALLAAVYQRLGNTKAAAGFSQRASQLPRDLPWPDPYVEAYVQLEVGRQARFIAAERLQKEGRSEEEARVLRAIREEFPDDRSHLALGMTLARQGDYAAAEHVLRSAIALSPEMNQAHYFLSVTLYYQGERLWKAGEREPARVKFREAVTAAQKATKLKPDHAYAFVFLGLSLKYLDKQEEALASYGQAVHLRPELAEAHLYLGEALADHGQLPEALVQLQHALRLVPRSDPRPLQALARALGHAALAGGS
jgi:tetratricopeptide (TPR) repeat protein